MNDVLGTDGVYGRTNLSTGAYCLLTTRNDEQQVMNIKVQR